MKIFFVLLYFIVIISAQSCELAQSSQQIHEQCRPFLSGIVFVNITDTANIYGTIRSLQLTPHKCALKTLELICQTFYPICNFTYSTTEILYPLPTFPCKSKCYKALDECEDYIKETQEIFKKTNRVFLDCDMKTNGLDRWPESYSVYPNLDGDIVTIGCNSDPTEVEISTMPLSCPYPMVLRLSSASSDESPCPVKCPLPLFLPHQYHHDWQFAVIIASVSLVCLTFLIISFSLSKNKRSFPQNLFINLFVCLLFCCIFIVSGEGGTKIVCHNGKPSTQSYAPCGLQGAMLLYFALGGSCWWFSIVLNLYLMVHGKIKASTISVIKYYYIFGWVYPLLNVIVCLSIQGFGYDTPNMICFLPVDGNKSWLQYAFYYGPIGVMMAVGGILSVLIIYNLINSYIKIGANVDKTNKSPYYKVSVFAVSYLFIWLALFSRLAIKSSVVEDSFISWLSCHLDSYNSFNDDEASIALCGSVPKIQPSRTIVQTQFVAMTIHGIIAFVIFFFDSDLYSGWKILYSRIFKKVFIYSKKRNLSFSSSSGSSSTVVSPMQP